MPDSTGGDTQTTDTLQARVLRRARELEPAAWEDDDVDDDRQCKVLDQARREIAAADMRDVLDALITAAEQRAFDDGDDDLIEATPEYDAARAAVAAWDEATGEEIVSSDPETA